MGKKIDGNEYLAKVDAFEQSMADALENDIKTAMYIVENDFLYHDKEVAKARKKLAKYHKAQKALAKVA